ncbi:exported hypothetical protein [Acidobacteriia bacterium SbA2]|nr:exported hypothetical protein [Acidobacteriia bacterium SbA2]
MTCEQLQRSFAALRMTYCGFLYTFSALAWTGPHPVRRLTDTPLPMGGRGEGGERGPLRATA